MAEEVVIVETPGGDPVNNVEPGDPDGPEVGIWEVIVIARDGQLGKDRIDGNLIPPAGMAEVRQRERARISENRHFFAFLRAR